MTKIVDVRSAGGTFAILGGALLLPTSSNSSDSTEGSIRYNTTTNVLELYTGGTWGGAVGSLVSSFNTRTGAIVLISSDVTTALGFTPVNASTLGQINGVATLDSSGKLTISQIPSSLVGAVVYQGLWNASTNTPTLTSGIGTKGYYYLVSVAGTTTLDGISTWNVGDTAIFNGTNWDKLDGTSSEVISVAGRTGAVVLSVGDVSGAAPIASPTFTGSPTAPTPAAGDNSLNLATTAYVNNLESGVATVTTTGGSTTLTASQYGSGTIIVSGTLTSNATLVVPNTGRWVFSNRTTGAFSVTIKTSAGTGIVVDQGYNNILVSDGTNCIYAKNDTSTVITLSGAITGSGSTTITTSFSNETNNTVLSNISGTSAAPIANTVSAVIDSAIGNVHGDIIYRDTSAWLALSPGTSGQVLQTNGPSANPSWATLGLASLPTMANNTILANISGSTTTPSADTLTAIIDSSFGNAQGNIIYRNATGWTVLAPGGSPGLFLQTQGTSANPLWASAVSSIATSGGITGGTITGTGTISLASISPQTVLSNVSGGTATPIGNTISAILDTIASAEGSILYRDVSSWLALSPGTSGQFLQTKGPSAIPAWQSVGYSSLPAELSNALPHITLPGAQTANIKCLILTITQAMIVPANFAGSVGWCGTLATSSSAYAVSYWRSGTTTSIGTLTFTSASHLATLSTQAAVNLLIDDVLIVTTPSVADTTLADVGITLSLTKE